MSTQRLSWAWQLPQNDAEDPRETPEHWTQGPMSPLPRSSNRRADFLLSFHHRSLRSGSLFGLFRGVELL